MGLAQAVYGNGVLAMAVNDGSEIVFHGRLPFFLFLLFIIGEREKNCKIRKPEGKEAHASGPVADYVGISMNL
jgi:hypothetical protein